MAKKRKKSPTVPAADVDITSMIDCVFLLLIFFMVTTVYKNPVRLNVQLPIISHSAKLEKARQIVCELDKDGKVAIGGKDSSFDTFDTFLASEKQKSGFTTLLIKADQETKHGDVLKLMKLARGVEVETMVMEVEAKNSSE